MLSKMLESVVNDYMSAFIGAVSTKYSLPQEDLVEMWLAIQKSKPKKPQQSIVPKKPRRQNSYQVFQKIYRPILVEKGMTFVEISKELGKMWKNLSDEEKKQYKEKTDKTDPWDTPLLENKASASDEDEEAVVGENKKPRAKKTTKGKTKSGPVVDEVHTDEDEVHTDEEPVVEESVEKLVSYSDEEKVQSDQQTKNDEFLEKLYPADPVANSDKEVFDTLPVDEEVKKPKRPKATKSTPATKMPDDLSPREKELWAVFQKMKKDELKQACEESGIKTGNKNEMILGLVKVRMALQDGFDAVDDEMDDDSAF